MPVDGIDQLGSGAATLLGAVGAPPEGRAGSPYPATKALAHFRREAPIRQRP